MIQRQTVTTFRVFSTGTVTEHRNTETWNWKKSWLVLTKAWFLFLFKEISHQLDVWGEGGWLVNSRGSGDFSEGNKAKRHFTSDFFKRCTKERLPPPSPSLHRRPIRIQFHLTLRHLGSSSHKNASKIFSENVSDSIYTFKICATTNRKRSNVMYRNSFIPPSAPKKWCFHQRNKVLHHRGHGSMTALCNFRQARQQVASNLWFSRKSQQLQTKLDYNLNIQHQIGFKCLSLLADILFLYKLLTDHTFVYKLVCNDLPVLRGGWLRPLASRKSAQKRHI